MNTTEIYKHCECKNAKELIQLIRSNGIETIDLSWPDDMGLWYTTTIRSHEVSLQNLVEGIKFSTQTLFVDSSSARFDTTKSCKTIVVKCSIQNNNNSSSSSSSSSSTINTSSTTNKKSTTKKSKKINNNTTKTTRPVKRSKKNNNNSDIATPPDILLSPSLSSQSSPPYYISSSDTSETDECSGNEGGGGGVSDGVGRKHRNNILFADQSPLSILIDQIENERSRVASSSLSSSYENNHHLSSDDETNSTPPSSSPRHHDQYDQNSPTQQQCPSSPSLLSSTPPTPPTLSSSSSPTLVPCNSSSNNKRKEMTDDWLELPKNKVELVPDLSNALAVAIQSTTGGSSSSVGAVPNTEFSLDNTERLIIEGQIQLPPLLRPRQYHACKVNKEEKVTKDHQSTLGVNGSVEGGDGAAGKEKRKKNHTMLCRHCGTGRTPEWRRGPDGRKSLCNACGLHYSKTIKRETINKQQENRTFNIIDLLNPVL